MLSAEFIFGTVFALIGGLVALAYRNYASHVAEKFDKVEKVMEDNQTEVKKSVAELRQDFDHEIQSVIEMHRKDHEASRVGVRDMVAQQAHVMTEIWAEIKQSRQERAAIDKAVWEAIERVAEKVNVLNLDLARAYPTKLEISQLLDEKFRNLKEVLRGYNHGT